MTITNLTVKLLILFLPGAIAAIVVDKLTVHEKWTPFEFSIHSLILGFLSYMLHQIILYIYAFLTYIPNVRNNYKQLNFWSCLFDDKINISFTEIIYTLVFSIIVGFIVSALVQHKVLSKLAKQLKVSTKFGDENLYSYLLNSPDVSWVTIRDKEQGVTYQGQIDSFSENESIREIALRNVKVFTYDTSELCYEVPSMYFSFNQDNIRLEVPILEGENNYEEGK